MAFTRELPRQANGKLYKRLLRCLLGEAMKQRLRYVGLAIVFVWFGFGGVSHFTSTPFFLRIVPPYVPYPLAVVYVSGVFEILGAIGIWIPRWRKWAGNGLFALTIAVTPANVYMSMHPQLFPSISETALTIRLFVQVLLLACIWWSTRPPSTAAGQGTLARSDA